MSEKGEQETRSLLESDAVYIDEDGTRRVKMETLEKSWSRRRERLEREREDG